MHLQSRPESSNRVLMGQRLSRLPREMAVELPNGRTLVVGGHPILEVNGCCAFGLCRSFTRRASRPALFPLFPLFPATTCGRGTRQAAENVSGFSAVPRVPRVPCDFEHRSRFLVTAGVLGSERRRASPTEGKGVVSTGVLGSLGRPMSHDQPRSPRTCRLGRRPEVLQGG